MKPEHEIQELSAKVEDLEATMALLEAVITQVRNLAQKALEVLEGDV